MMRFIPTIHECLILLCMAILSAAIGLGVNALSGSPLHLIYQASSHKFSLANSQDHSALSIRVVNLHETIDIVQHQSALILDARPRLFYEIGHLPGAQNLSHKAFEDDYNKHRKLLTKALASGSPLLIYCTDLQCPDASKVASILREKGYSSILIFEGGWAEWNSSELGRTTSDAF